MKKWSHDILHRQWVYFEPGQFASAQIATSEESGRLFAQVRVGGRVRQVQWFETIEDAKAWCEAVQDKEAQGEAT